VPLPDIALGQPGQGFTCTGLAYDKAEDVYYIGNYGKNTPKDKVFQATIVKVSKDFTKNLGEIELYKLFPDMKDIQGLTVDTSDGSIWFSSYSEGKIRHIAKDGTDLGSFKLKGTGICYDSRTDTLWVLTSDMLHNVDKTGKKIESIDCAAEGQKQIFLDEANDTIFFTAGNSTVYKIELETGAMFGAFNLKTSYASEGLFISGQDLFILNDGFYRGSKVPVNQVNHYDIGEKEG
jgi:hypothetical protein